MNNLKSTTKKIAALLFQQANRISWLVSLLIILISLIFLYDNFYRSVSDARVLSALKSQVASQAVDMELWEKINKDMKWKKHKLLDEDIKKNPFE